MEKKSIITRFFDLFRNTDLNQPPSGLELWLINFPHHRKSQAMVAGILLIILLAGSTVAFAAKVGPFTALSPIPTATATAVPLIPTAIPVTPTPTQLPCVSTCNGVRPVPTLKPLPTSSVPTPPGSDSIQDEDGR